MDGGRGQWEGEVGGSSTFRRDTKERTYLKVGFVIEKLIFKSLIFFIFFQLILCTCLCFFIFSYENRYKFVLIYLFKKLLNDDSFDSRNKKLRSHTRTCD